MTEMTQSLASVPSEAHTVASSAATARVPSFPELVYAHFDWWRETHSGSLTEATKTRYEQAHAAFQETHGAIVKAYWCSHIESAVVLTEKPGRFSWSGPQCGFHRESDWATQDWPDIAAELHRCDELSVRAKTVLTGVRQRICMSLVMASASHLMSLVDRRAANGDKLANSSSLAQEQLALTKAETYYDDAANGQAQIIYFVGMAVVAAILGIGSAIWLAINWASPVAALVAGATGAVVSVIQRITAGKFALDYDVGRPYALFLGGLRPLIGGAFAMAITFAFTGGLLHLPVAAGESGDHRRLALLVISFFAGFSERWAQDTLAAALPSMAPKAETAAVVASTTTHSTATAADAEAVAHST
jgi:hypothetical protein